MGPPLNPEKRKIWIENRSGDNNPMRKYASARKKISLSRMGDKNPSKRPDVRKKISDKAIGHKCSKETREKISNSLKGSKNPFYRKKHTEDSINKIKNARLKQILPLKDSSIEIILQDFLKELKIKFVTHKYMKIKHGYQCDIFIPSLNLVIEADGDYWHKYPWGREIDRTRTQELIENGFNVLRLWEFEIRAMDIDSFKVYMLKNYAQNK